MNFINTSDLVGTSFLMETNENGENFVAKPIQAIKEHNGKLKCQSAHIKYVCYIYNCAYEAILSYTKIL